jgi:23S rRNA G2069 N7-methylase RlmK/C1962 C5-methylase RlmI
VLDLCCYAGGFALSAAAGGAAEVLGIDSSPTAVELARANVELNSWQETCDFQRADVEDFMKQALEQRRQWDLVVLDPPKLAPNRRALDKATRRYRRLNSLAMRLVAPGGLLMTCSCSGAMSQSDTFVPTLQQAARDAGRRVTVLREAGAAPDHTIDPAYPEGRYLTNVLLRVL